MKKTNNELWADPVFGSRLDSDVQKAQDEANRKKHGGVDCPDAGFSRLAADTPGSLRNAINRLASSNDREVRKVLVAAGVRDDKPMRLTLHTSSGRELPVQIARRDQLWIAFVPDKGEWREFQAVSYDALLSLLMKTFDDGPKIRELTSAESLSVARLCAAGKLEDALIMYIRGRCGDVTPDVVNDPNYRAVTDAAAWFVFKHSTNEFEDTKPAREFMNRFVGDRPVTLGLLRSAFAAWKEQKAEPQHVSVSTTPAEPEPTQVNEQEFEHMSDNQVRGALTAVRREYAEGERRRRDLLRLNNAQRYRTPEQVLADLHNVPQTE